MHILENSPLYLAIVVYLTIAILVFILCVLVYFLQNQEI